MPRIEAVIGELETMANVRLVVQRLCTTLEEAGFSLEPINGLAHLYLGASIALECRDAHGQLITEELFLKAACKLYRCALLDARERELGAHDLS